MNVITTLRTIKGKSLEELDAILVSLLNSNQGFGKEIREFLKGQFHSSIFVIQDSTDNIHLARIAFTSIILADIATVPDQHMREIYTKPIRELCKQYEIGIIDVEIFSKYVSALETLLTISQNQ